MSRHPNKYTRAVQENREILESYSVQELRAEGYHWGRTETTREELIDSIARRVARAEHPSSLVYYD